jgi:hypothetical protein
MNRRELESSWFSLLNSAAEKDFVGELIFGETGDGPFQPDSEILEGLIREWSPYWVTASELVN